MDDLWVKLGSIGILLMTKGVENARYMSYIILFGATKRRDCLLFIFFVSSALTIGLPSWSPS